MDTSSMRSIPHSQYKFDELVSRALVDEAISKQGTAATTLTHGINISNQATAAIILT